MYQNNSDLASEFGEEFMYFFKGTSCLSNCIKSCFAYKRDNTLVSDDQIVMYDKSSILRVLNRAVGPNEVQYEFETPLRKYEVDIGSIIVFFTYIFAKFNKRCTVSLHMYLHALEYLVKHERNQDYGLGIVNASEFEATHSKVRQIFAFNMPLEVDSEVYGRTLLDRLNQYNARNIDTAIITT